MFSFSRYLLFGNIIDSPIDMVLPTGAMGNLTGAYMAKQMGVPIGKLYCGVNSNGKKRRQTKGRIAFL
jgi:threonine synthase